MSFSGDAHYFADQAIRHDRMAEQATNRAARAAHRELGRRYAVKAIALGSQPLSPLAAIDASMEQVVG